jgi:asparagine synthase (glutamine-hydrolysing)
VSGGLDSSGVFAMANLLLSQGRLQAPALRGYTYDFGPNCDPQVDELEYGRAVADHLGAELQEVSPFLPDWDWFLERGRIDRDMPPYANAAMATNIGRALVANGSRVDLNGEGGDEFLAGDAFYYGDQIMLRDWRALGRSFCHDWQTHGLARSLAKLWRGGIGPTLPPALRAARRHFRRMTLQDAHGLGFAWLAPELREHLARRRETAERALLDGIRSPAQRRLYLTLTYPFTVYAHDYLNRNAAHVGYELRSPMYGREFIEYAFAIPAELRMRGGVSKHIHVEALAGLLPEKVLRRRTDVSFVMATERMLDSDQSPMLGILLQRGIDFVDAFGLRELERLYRRSERGFGPFYELWAVVGCVNLWGRA